jgi:hypothetical protein
MVLDRGMRSSRLSALLALALLCSSVAVFPLAYASPPDPSWIRGLYDDADLDDVVVLLTSGCAVIDGLLEISVGRGQFRLGRTTSTDDIIGTRPEFAPLQPRAPPTL